MNELSVIADAIPLSAERILEVSSVDRGLGQVYHRRNDAAHYVRFCWQDFETVSSHVRSISDSLPLSAVLLLDPPDIDALLKFIRLVVSHTGPETLCVIKVENRAHWSHLDDMLLADKELVPGANHSSLLLSLRELQNLCKENGFVIDKTQASRPTLKENSSVLDAYLELAKKRGLKERDARLKLETKSWLIRVARETAAPRKSVVALTIRKFAGVNEARVDYPLRALQSIPGYDILWGQQFQSVPARWAPGVLVLHRKFLKGPGARHFMENLIRQGWVVLSDIDDDPHHWPDFVNSNFLEFRGVHAVTVSSKPLADMISEWNPNVEIFDNAIFELPQPFGEEEVGDGKIRIFFGAINRTKEWHIIAPEIFRAIREVDRKVELVVVHDKKVFESVPEDISKQFYPTLDHDAYLRVLSQCQIALLPLEDTSFNRLKSDLKFIECCAAKVVPICSPVVYDQKAEHLEIGCFAAAQEEWYHHLKRLLIDGQERIERSKKGFEYVKRSRMHCYQVEGRRAFYQSLLARRQDLEQQRLNRLRALGLA